MVFPLVLSRAGAFLFGDIFDSGVLDMTQRIVLGALIIAFLILEPDGLSALWTGSAPFRGRLRTGLRNRGVKAPPHRRTDTQIPTPDGSGISRPAEQRSLA